MKPISSFEFTFTTEREFWYFITMVILPLALIVTMSWLTYWIDPKELAPQISIAVTAMAKASRLQTAFKIDRCARVLFPLALTAAIVFSFVI